MQPLYSEINALAKEQTLKYDTVTFIEDLATKGVKSDSGFQVTTASGNEFFSQKLIFATGIKDLLPDIEGFAACWGKSIVHCPYCHGYELRHRKTAIYADVHKAMHLAPLVRNLTDDLTLIVPPNSTFEQEELQLLDRNNIVVTDAEIQKIEHQNGQLQSIVFSDGTKQAFDGLYAGLPFEQHSSIPEDLGCNFTEQGHIEVDAFCKTSIEGLYACGDNSSMMRSVANAVYSGNIAGAIVNMELANERF